MLKLIHADLYKVFHRAYFYIMMAILAALCVFVNFAIHGSGAYNTASFSVTSAISFLSFPVILLPMLTEVVSAEEYRDHTIKNTLSFGTNRTVLFLSKSISAVILGVILMVVVVVVYFGSMMILLPKDANFTSDFMREFFIRLGASCSVYVACISMAIFFTVLFNKSTLAIFLYYGAFYLTDLLFKLFHFSKGIDYLLKSQISNITALPIVKLQTPVTISLVTMLVFLVAGIAVFRRRDVC